MANIYSDIWQTTQSMEIWDIIISYELVPIQFDDIIPSLHKHRLTGLFLQTDVKNKTKKFRSISISGKQAFSGVL